MKKMKNISKKLLKSQLFWCILIILCTIIIRLLVLNIISNDYHDFLHGWYETIMQNGKLDSLKITISNYPDSYMFLLSLGTYITTNSLLWVKLLSTIFDFILALYVYKIYKTFQIKHSSLKSLLVLLIPGVLLNSAVLGQCDVIYTTFCIMFIYYILKNKPNTALFCFGIAISFKIQALFIAPIILYLLLTKKIQIRHLLMMVIGFIVPFIPTMIVGKGLIENLKILLTQTVTYPTLVRSAPNVYSLLFLNYITIHTSTKYILSTITILLTVYLVMKGDKKQFSEKTFLSKLMILSLLVPFFLPAMHDRYFYMANLIIYLYYMIYQHKNAIKVICLSMIAYAIPVISINFLLFNRQWFLMTEYILVSIVSSWMNVYIIYCCMKDTSFFSFHLIKQKITALYQKK